MTKSHSANDFTSSRRRRKNQRPFGRKRHWIHPHFEVGLFVEDSRALPARIRIIRHIDGALSVATSSKFTRVTAIDDFDRDCKPEIYSIVDKSTWTEVSDENGEIALWPKPPKLTSFGPVQSTMEVNDRRRP